MCDPVSASLAIASGITNYEAQKSAYNAQKSANARNRKAARGNYLQDVASLQQEAQEKATSYAREQARLRIERRNKMAEAFNSGATNWAKVSQDVTLDANNAFVDNMATFESDQNAIFRKSKEAYGAFESVWISQPTPTRPNLVGIALSSAATGLSIHAGMK